MRNLKALSFVTVAVIIVLIAFSGTRVFLGKNMYQGQIELKIKDATHSLEEIKDISRYIELDTIAMVEEGVPQSKKSLDLTELENTLEDYQQIAEEKVAGTNKDPFANPKFWIKVAFSFIFCFSALYVVLSKSYDEETKKWAYSVLTLIAGVWIGTL